jgi:hypothetical protein
MRNLWSLFATFLLCTLIAGCASGVTRTITKPPTYKVSKTQPVGAIVVSLTAEATGKAADNSQFSAESLKKQLEKSLIEDGLLNHSLVGKSPSILIEVKSMRVRSSFSAIMLGIMAGTDSITGDIVIKDVLGKEVDRFEVSASYGLGGFGGGQDDVRMGWLYEQFAKEVISEITGKRKET